MAKITKEQLARWNSKASNGFEFDLKYFLVWNEKRLTKVQDIPNSDDKLETVIEYYEEFTHFGEPVVYDIETRMTRWTPSKYSEGVYAGIDSCHKTLHKGYGKKVYSNLCKASKDDIEEIQNAEKEFLAVSVCYRAQINQ